MEISEKHKVIYAIAKGLRYGDEECHKEMKGADLAALLNELGYKSEKGEPYAVGSRGIYNCITAAYKAFMQHDGNDERAGWIATAFCDKNGNYPWE